MLAELSEAQEYNGTEHNIVASWRKSTFQCVNNTRHKKTSGKIFMSLFLLFIFKKEMDEIFWAVFYNTPDNNWALRSQY